MKMSPVKTKDPKTFIQPKAPPIPTHQGLRIQARSDTHYNCETPSREEVFLGNYARRQRQKSEQGYNSPNWKPYQMLGEPMHLDDKKLILHALGQLDENSIEDFSGSSDEEGDDGKEKEKKEHKSGVTSEEEKDRSRKFIVRRSSKSRKSLSKEVTVGRKMVNWTKLGHGLFNTIREQDEERSNAEENERKLKEEKRRTEWQPPTVESSGDDETDEELAKEEDLSVFMDNSDMRKEVSFLGVSSTDDSDMATLRDDMQSQGTESRLAPTSILLNPTSGLLTPFGPTPTPVPPGTGRMGSGTKKKKKRRNLEDARPYTPCRTNISLGPYDDRPNRTALFRQLCALNWILEAMITEPPAVMEPIIKCWNIKYKELKQNTFCKTTMRKQRNDKALDTRWTSFVTNPGAGHLRSKPTKFGASLTASSAALMSSNRVRKMSVASGTYRRSGMSGSIISQTTDRRDGHASRRGSASRKGSVVSRQDGSPSGRCESAAKKDGRSDVSPRRDGPRELSKGLTKFLDEIYESASNPGARPIEEGEETRERDRSPSAVSEVSMPEGGGIQHTEGQQFAESQQGSSNKSSSNKNRPTLSAKQLEERAKQIQKPPEQQINRWVTNTTLKLHSRARSAPAKDPRAAFPSQKLKHMPNNLRNKFADVTEDNALTLHDKLEAMEKRRLWRSEEKFRAIRTNLHISAQLELFKRAGMEPEDEDDKQRLKIHVDDDSKWFQELMRNLPQDIMQDRQCSAVVEKLQSMGKIESRKVTPQKFLDVLATLKQWELCSPDISAAIEFVRDKVVGMTVDNFEAWYQSEVPDIVRSRSAPLF